MSKIGQIAISQINFDEWMKKPPKRTLDKKSAIQKDVLYPSFEECMQQTNDDFWKEKFQKASIGKFPKTFTFKDNMLIHRKGTKIFSLDLSDIETSELSTEIINFFKKHGNIYSNKDMEDSMALYHKPIIKKVKRPVKTNESESSEESSGGSDDSISVLDVWTSFSKKNKEVLIYHYLDETKKNMKLNTKETDQLKNTILLSISNKMFDKTNIKIKDKKIESFDDLFWDDGKRIFYVNPKLKVKNPKVIYKIKSESAVVTYDKNKTPYFLAEWEKYCQFLEEKVNNIRKLPMSLPIGR